MKHVLPVKESLSLPAAMTEQEKSFQVLTPKETRTTNQNKNPTQILCVSEVKSPPV